MRFLICTGVGEKEVGGPAQYVFNLKKEFEKKSIDVKILPYKVERKLPILIRHFYYFLRILFNLRKVDCILALDIVSTGFPAVAVGKLFKRKVVLRVSGDFLWETYANKNIKPITLIDFNQNTPKLSFKEKLISFFQSFSLENSTALVFNTQWLRDVFDKKYNLKAGKNFVVENYFSQKNNTGGYERIKKVFLWAGRPIKLKNLELLQSAFSKVQRRHQDIELKIIENLSHSELMQAINNCYAVILPSISDVSPNFISEAISYNKPFIMTKETGLFFKLEQVGLFVDPFKEDDIQEKILFLLDDNNYIAHKKKIVEFDFAHSWTEIAEEFLSICKNI